jgi:hypothetical protein
MSEIRIPADMLRRRLVDVVPFGLRDVCGMIAVALCGTGFCGWLIVLASKSFGDWQ